MLIASVVLYLLVTIAIGLWAAMRVKNSKDYVVAGRSLPLYMNTATVFATWFGAESVLSVSVEFSKSGLGGIIADPFGSSVVMIIVGLGVIAWFVGDMAGGPGKIIAAAAAEGKFEFWPKGGVKEWLAFTTAFLTLA